MLEAKDTGASVLQKKKKKKSKKFFRRSPKKVFKNFFPVIYKILPIQKIVLSASRGQGNFRGLEASSPRTSKCAFEDSTSGLEDKKLIISRSKLNLHWCIRRWKWLSENLSALISTYFKSQLEVLTIFASFVLSGIVGRTSSRIQSKTKLRFTKKTNSTLFFLLVFSGSVSLVCS